MRIPITWLAHVVEYLAGLLIILDVTNHYIGLNQVRDRSPVADYASL